MRSQREAAQRRAPERRRSERRGFQRGGERRRPAAADSRPADAPPHKRQRSPDQRPTPARSTSQAKARAKARKAKAPKVIRPPLRELLLARVSEIDLNPRTLAAKVPFVVLVIGSLGVGLGLTLWLSTDSAERSYELGNARETNRALQQHKEALERDVLEAQAAPALAEAARNLGMIPSRDTAHLVQDPAGNWVVVGTPKPAEGAPPPPLNTPLPDDQPAPPAPVVVDRTEIPVRVTRTPAPGTAATPLAGGPEVMVRNPGPEAAPPPAVPLGEQHGTSPAAAPGPVPAEAIPAPVPPPVPAPPPADAPQVVGPPA